MSSQYSQWVLHKPSFWLGWCGGVIGALVADVIAILAWRFLS